MVCIYVGDPEMHTNAKGSAIVVEEVEQPKVVTASPRENVVFTCQTQNVSVGDYGDLQRIQWLYQGKLIEGQHGKVRFIPACNRVQGLNC